MRSPAVAAFSFSTIPLATAISILGALLAIAFCDPLMLNDMSHCGRLPVSTLAWGRFPLPFVGLNSSTGSSSVTWRRPTEEVHASPNGKLVGKYVSIRQDLDYSYHSIYSEQRQRFQDEIVDAMLSQALIEDSNGEICSRPQSPWIVFTAGAMGAGKSHTIRTLGRKKYFPLESFVLVDPDEIRRKLPEFDVYVKHCPEDAGELTRKEAGMIEEIAVEAALRHGYNVLVDGSLRNEWYEGYIQTLRKTYPDLRIAILHVTAPREAVFRRALVSFRSTML